MNNMWDFSLCIEQYINYKKQRAFSEFVALAFVTLKTEAKAKSKVVHRGPNQLVLNCKRFSHFQPFTHHIITQNTTHSDIMHLYRCHSASISIGKGEGADEESKKKWRRKKGVWSKKWCPSHKFFHVLFYVTHSLFLLGFSWSSELTR